MSKDATSLLGGMDVAAFLKRHWQKRPLVVRGAIPGFTSPLAPEELAGLACDEDVTSRLVLEHGGDRPWQVRRGPFKDEDFTSLGEGGWTLTVHEVDQLVPAVADLLQRFRFVPNWRIDGVTVSYAPRAAGVGAQIEDDDVFLLQARGRWRWQVQHAPVVDERGERDERLVPDLGMRTLADFAPDEEWVLEPGDMLYLPPRIAHRGVALDDSMTLSIGCAAPDAGELFAAFVTAAIESSLEDRDDPLSLALNRRYADPDLTEQEEPGEIAGPARRRLHAMLRDVLADEQAFDRWLGRFLTAPRRIGPRAPERPTDGVVPALRRGAELLRSAVAHFAHLEVGGTPYLYVGGSEYPLEDGLEFAGPLLSGRLPLDLPTLEPHLTNPAVLKLIAALLDDGFLELR